MAREPFRFALEPEVIVRSTERDQLEREVQELKSQRDAAQTAHQAAQDRLLATRERHRGESEQLFASKDGQVLDPELLHARSQFLDELARQAERQEQERHECQRALALAENKLQEARQDLAEIEARLEALERARAKELKVWKAEQEKLAEKARDEDAGLRWTHENRGRRPRS